MVSRFSFLLISTLIFCQAYAHDHHKELKDKIPSPIQGASIYNLKSYWTTQDEKSAQLLIFKNHPVVLAMIYTSCKEACPLIVSDMQKIERGLNNDVLAQTRFVLVSFDPDTDTPKGLKNYAKAHGLDLKKWTLLHGSQAQVRELAAILDVRYKKIKDGDFEHSNVISILDSEGVIKHQQVGLNQDPTETLDALQLMIKK